MHRIICSLFWLAIVAVFYSPSKADFIITFKDAEIPARGFGSIDVLLTSSSDTSLSGFSLMFEISAESTGGVLEFQPDELQSDSERSFSSPDYNYVFFNSLGIDGFSADRQNNRRQIITGDFAGNSEGVPIVANADYLLARLELQHEAPIGSTGGTFRIRLLNETSNTGFQNASNDLQLAASSFSNFGTISVSAVPEPSSLILSGIAVSGLLVSRFRRKK